jgi:hypothetical protein
MHERTHSYVAASFSSAKPRLPEQCEGLSSVLAPKLYTSDLHAAQPGYPIEFTHATNSVYQATVNVHADTAGYVKVYIHTYR